jgi:hypothetical protein
MGVKSIEAILDNREGVPALSQLTDFESAGGLHGLLATICDAAFWH